MVGAHQITLALKIAMKNQEVCLEDLYGGALDRMSVHPTSRGEGVLEERHSSSYTYNFRGLNLMNGFLILLRSVHTYVMQVDL